MKSKKILKNKMMNGDSSKERYCIQKKQNQRHGFEIIALLIIIGIGLSVLTISITELTKNFKNQLVQTAMAQTEGKTKIPNNSTLQGISNSTSGSTRLPSQEGFSTKVLAKNLTAPHNIIYGPDGALWITERIAKNITRIDPNTGMKLSITPVPNVLAAGGQDGLMGMVFDPNYNKTHHFYVAYTYNAAATNTTGQDVDRKTKITRFTYDPTTHTISQPVDIIKGLSGSTDHNSGRLVFGLDSKLYYTIGDQGKNQLSNYCLNNLAQHLPTQEQINSQNWSTYEGKVLRMNPDGSIPNDNPTINGIQSHIFTYGHRNPQGMAVGPNGDIYIAEHGDKSDDEVNHLVAGGNYGWPYVAGSLDEQAYQFVNWSAAKNCHSLKWTNTAPPPAGVPVLNESDFNATNFVPPVATFYTVKTGYNFIDPACGKDTYICWPTVAPSTLRLYTYDNIPGWKDTFLMTTLKGGKIFHLTPDKNGTSLAVSPKEMFRSEDRYRDLTFSPDGSTIYVITDSFGPVQAINGGATHTLWNPGSLLMFKHNSNSLSTPQNQSASQ